MPIGEGNESKAQKLAAARKKLREYQNRSTADHSALVGATVTSTESHSSSIAGGSSISSNISEASDCDSSTNGLDVANQSTPTNTGIAAENSKESNTIAGVSTVETALNGESATPTTVLSLPSGSPTAASNFGEFRDIVTTIPVQQQQQNVNTIQVLINEKATLTTELNKYRCLCRERELDAEELRTQLEAMTRRQDELTQHYKTQQQNVEQLRKTNAELQHKLAQTNSKQEDEVAHMDELKRLLDTMQERATQLDHQLKEKSNELEMAQLRIRQLSDEANVNQSDNRVETLTQTQFMYEQQIRDLQAMVQQLSYDKEQANNQYQSYVQHLNAEVRSLNEKNSELMDECTKQQERERQLVDHISALEKDIQKNISRQDQLKKDKDEESSPDAKTVRKELEQLKELVNDFDMERHEFQLKIKSQEDRLVNLNSELQEKQTKLEHLEEYMKNYAAEQPDKTKLLATMESDKIAASRALTQNMELKKQLDELELRFVQLTNDKADLMNRLDAEEHANRKMRENYTLMEEQLHSMDERYKFKDEEMIRLSHENIELMNKAQILEKKLAHQQHRRVELHRDLSSEGDHELQEHIKEHTQHENDVESLEHNRNGFEANNEHNDHTHEHGTKQEDGDGHEHNHDHIHHHHHHDEHDNSNNEALQMKKYSSSGSNTSTPHLPTDEAVEKLEQRFTRLMSQVADLTDEKQRLEHIVLQLQGETETIGEYITLYQTQRRMLKQREYEKAAQMQLLQHERIQLRKRIALLNNLVSSLSADIPQRLPIQQQNFNAMLTTDYPNDEPYVDSATTVATPDSTMPIAIEASEALEIEQQQSLNPHMQHTEAQLQEKLTATESRQILTKIQDIISEINENTQRIPDVATAQTVDHLNCCLGKIEVV